MCRRMRFFSRSKVFLWILTGITVVFGIICVFKHGMPFGSETSLYPILILLIIGVIALKLIVKDAEEDLAAILNYASSKNQPQEEHRS